MPRSWCVRTLICARRSKGRPRSNSCGSLANPVSGLIVFLCRRGRCCRAVDSSSDGSPTFVVIAAEAQPQSVPRSRCGKANRATHAPFAPGPHSDGLACDRLRLGVAQRGRRRRALALVDAPSSRGKPWAATWRSPCLQREQPLSLASAKDLRAHGPTTVSERVPEPARRRVLAAIAPLRIACCSQAAVLGQLVSTIHGALHLRWGQRLSPRLLSFTACVQVVWR